ncbi:hypothetical protein [Ehrlichia canis]|uniref:Uncharacterized protein n=1 Tax=Ehrlichia canis (strain Jake) TaxID=269484 RepID=A0ACA6AX30_EHRCJ|nr:hypothetical protein [Ehrlichia canis]AAZ68954.1 hypothetical protein Ecaj_0923 [Ehrlichia canis str. Jake]AUO55154.1 hypothetical protein C1I72_04850 [Ehrlichia canis]UKC53631.1 hypothetical protein s20019040002_000674 [Ehrlichia canis]UKC54569.1 hypothetical protein s20026770001_000675 [Ehrlichia canis]UKC55505.1 hypothetical protein s21009500007_000675 [Ehrlichia canis]
MGLYYNEYQNDHQIDFLIQQNGHSNVDIYHGTLHINGNEGKYYASASIVNDLTGDKGTINILNHGVKGIYSNESPKCDLEITLEHYDPASSDNIITSINKSFIVSVFSNLQDCLLIDSHNPLLMDPSKVEQINKEPVIAVLVHDGIDTKKIRDSFFNEKPENKEHKAGGCTYVYSHGKTETKCE